MDNYFFYDRLKQELNDELCKKPESQNFKVLYDAYQYSGYGSLLERDALYALYLHAAARSDILLLRLVLTRLSPMFELHLEIIALVSSEIQELEAPLSQKLGHRIVGFGLGPKSLH